MATLALLVTGCNRGEEPLPNVLEDEGPFCEFVDRDLLRAAMPEGAPAFDEEWSYELGERAPWGDLWNCNLTETGGALRFVSFAQLPGTGGAEDTLASVEVFEGGWVVHEEPEDGRGRLVRTYDEGHYLLLETEHYLIYMKVDEREVASSHEDLAALGQATADAFEEVFDPEAHQVDEPETDTATSAP